MRKESRCNKYTLITTISHVLSIMDRKFTQYLQVLQVVDSNLDFKIGKVTVQCATFVSIQNRR